MRSLFAVLIALVAFVAPVNAHDEGSWGWAFDSVENATTVSYTAADVANAVERYQDYEGCIVFTATWCKPCNKDYDEVWQEFIHKHPNALKHIRFVNMDNEPATAEAFGVSFCPTTIIVQANAITREHSGPFETYAALRKFYFLDTTPASSAYLSKLRTQQLPQQQPSQQPSNFYVPQQRQQAYGSERYTGGLTIGGTPARNMSRDALASHMDTWHPGSSYGKSHKQLGEELSADHRRGWDHRKVAKSQPMQVQQQYAQTEQPRYEMRRVRVCGRNGCQYVMRRVRVN